MKQAKFKVGDRVYYHSENPDAAGYFTIRIVQPEGIPSHRKPVYWLDGKAGCVSEDFLRRSDDQ